MILKSEEDVFFPENKKKSNKVIQEISGWSMLCGSYSRIAVPRVTFWKKEKNVFRYGQWECVYQISGLYRFSFGRGAWHTRTHEHTQKYVLVKIGIPLPPARLPWILKKKFNKAIFFHTYGFLPHLLTKRKNDVRAVSLEKLPRHVGSRISLLCFVLRGEGLKCPVKWASVAYRNIPD